jgi:hypothetical protein
MKYVIIIKYVFNDMKICNMEFIKDKLLLLASDLYAKNRLLIDYYISENKLFHDVLPADVTVRFSTQDNVGYTYFVFDSSEQFRTHVTKNDFIISMENTRYEIGELFNFMPMLVEGDTEFNFEAPTFDEISKEFERLQ